MFLCSTTKSSSVYDISICSCLSAIDTISDAVAMLAVLRSVLRRVGIMTREKQGMMPGKKSIAQEIRCKPSSCYREADTVCVHAHLFSVCVCCATVLSKGEWTNYISKQTQYIKQTFLRVREGRGEQ